eukprot:6671969-Pyramimonas_sp.AAC.1
MAFPSATHCGFRSARGKEGPPVSDAQMAARGSGILPVSGDGRGQPGARDSLAPYWGSSQH